MTGTVLEFCPCSRYCICNDDGRWKCLHHAFRKWRYPTDLRSRRISRTFQSRIQEGRRHFASGVDSRIVVSLSPRQFNRRVSIRVSSGVSAGPFRKQLPDNFFMFRLRSEICAAGESDHVSLPRKHVHASPQLPELPVVSQRISWSTSLEYLLP